MRQQIIWNEEKNTFTLVTKNEDGSLLVEPMTIEEATQWTAEHRW